jgi:titin
MELHRLSRRAVVLHPVCWALLAFALTLTCVSHADASTYVVSNANDSGGGSLRDQIAAANSSPGADQIVFAIPGPGPHTIHLLSPLPAITDTLEIDGTTQPGFAGSPVIELDGTSAGSTANGLELAASNCRVVGLVINRFAQNGVVIWGCVENHAIKGNYIGTDTTGAFDLGNGWHGIFLWATDNDTIGGTTAAERNVISGNDSAGVCADYTNGWGLVVGNYIGTDATGTDSLGNGTHGVEARNSSSLYVGGPLAGQGNVISGNDSCGVCIHDNGLYVCRVEGNYIGTDVTGAVPLGNAGDGVCIYQARGNQIGETTASARNVISGNALRGVFIFASPGNVIEGNYIGVDATGTFALGNGYEGVLILHGAGNTIGGTSPGARNIISGNLDEGVYATADSTVIQGNYIGTDVTGTADLGNSGNGVSMTGAVDITLGGTSPGAGNIVSANGWHGVYVASVNTVIQGNYIGTDVSGTADLGNAGDGIFVQGASGNTIGGTSPGAGNIISCNTSDGVYLEYADSNLVQGNYIGTDINGTGALGNSGTGVWIRRGIGSTIGGASPTASNAISHNGQQGVLICEEPGWPQYNNAILGNSIHSNVALGIDLASAWPGDGPTANDSCDLDTGPNSFQNYPVLTLQSAGPPLTLVDVFLNSTPNTAFRFEFFENSQPDSSGYGEGETFIGWADSTTDALGNVSFTVFFDPPIQLGHCITATATDPNGNTSEFSQVVYVGEGITLNGRTAGGALQLDWTALPGAAAYQLYGAENEAYFEAGPPYFLFELPSTITTWSGLPAVGDVDHNWTYVVIAIGDYFQEMARSNRFGEFDFDTGN